MISIICMLWMLQRPQPAIRFPPETRPNLPIFRPWSITTLRCPRQAAVPGPVIPNPTSSSGSNSNASAPKSKLQTGAMILGYPSQNDVCMHNTVNVVSQRCFEPPHAERNAPNARVASKPEPAPTTQQAEL